MNPRLFRNGAIARADTPDPVPGDVLVGEDGRIAGVEAGLTPPEGADVVDCRGRILLPGLFDLHVHLREPGREDKETIETGAEAAINGGVTGLLAMPNTTPAIDTGGMVRFVLTLARDRARIPVLTSGCITKNRAGDDLADIADMVERGAVMITDDGSPVSNPYVLRRAMEYSQHFDLILASHCETMDLSGHGAMNEGRESYRLGVPGIPACSEEICLDRDCRLAQHTGARLHIQHVSTRRGMETVKRYKDEGVRVTCEVTPHHLLFNEQDIAEYNTHLKMNPPLRTAEDNDALLQGLVDGVFDVLATDHAPHTRFEKNMDFGSAPFGITGLETALLSLYDRLIQPGRLSWGRLVEAFCAEPRRILGRPAAAIEAGAAAEFVVFDPAATTRVSEDFMKSKSINTPFLNQPLKGSVERVVLAGEDLLHRREEAGGGLFPGSDAASA